MRVRRSGSGSLWRGGLGAALFTPFAVLIDALFGLDVDNVAHQVENESPVAEIAVLASIFMVDKPSLTF